jgi:hypothetical protein
MGRRGSIPKAVVLPSLRQTTGVSSAGGDTSAASSPSVSTTEATPATGTAAAGRAVPSAYEDFTAALGGHAWVDDEGEMDYSFVPFADEQPGSFSPIASIETSAMDSPDPVISALQQRLQHGPEVEEEGVPASPLAPIDPHPHPHHHQAPGRHHQPMPPQKDRLEVVAEARRAAQQRIEALMQMQRAKPSIPVAVGGKRRDEEAVPGPAAPLAASPMPGAPAPPPAANWRATAAPVGVLKRDNKVRVLGKAGGPAETRAAIASSAAVDVGAPSAESSPRKTAAGLDFLIRSVRQAVEMHAQPAPDIHGNPPKAEPAGQVAVSQVAVGQVAGGHGAVSQVAGSQVAVSQVAGGQVQEPPRVTVRKRAPSLGAMSTVSSAPDGEDGRPLLIRMHPGDQAVKSHLTIKQQHIPTPRTAPAVHRSWQEDLSRISLSGLTT